MSARSARQGNPISFSHDSELGIRRLSRIGRVGGWWCGRHGLLCVDSNAIKPGSATCCGWPRRFLGCVLDIVKQLFLQELRRNGRSRDTRRLATLARRNSAKKCRSLGYQADFMQVSFNHLKGHGSTTRIGYEDMHMPSTGGISVQWGREVVHPLMDYKFYLLRTFWSLFVRLIYNATEPSKPLT
jgi:hypothetical protein